MAVWRDRPYGRCNFLVDLGTGGTDGPDAGFQEISGIDTSVDIVEYRNGNDKETTVRKLVGLSKCANVTLKRGIVGSLSLYQWFNEVRNGDLSAVRTVVISLQSEDHTAIVLTWKLLRCRPVRLKWGPLDGRGKDVAVEEVELAYERLEVE